MKRLLIEPETTYHRKIVSTQQLTDSTQQLTDSINTFQINNEPRKKISIVTCCENVFKLRNILVQLVKGFRKVYFSLKGPSLCLKLLNSRFVQVKWSCFIISDSTVRFKHILNHFYLTLAKSSCSWGLNDSLRPCNTTTNKCNNTVTYCLLYNSYQLYDQPITNQCFLLKYLYHSVNCILVFISLQSREMALSEELRWSMVAIKWNIILEMPHQFKHNVIVRLLNTYSITALDIQIPNLQTALLKCSATYLYCATIWITCYIHARRGTSNREQICGLVGRAIVWALTVDN